MDEAEGRMTTVLQENLDSIRAVRAFARQDYEKEKFNGASAGYRDQARGPCGAALRCTAQDPTDLDTDPSEGLDVDGPDESGPDDGGSEISDARHVVASTWLDGLAGATHRTWS